ncbi:hypothetical protein BDD16_001049 [Sphaerotilus montanus]|uniref:Uncharacterized protein n=1 Tax=Sphaerotilus montanus TaxID=522889 RepID=A0A7Y9QYD9_9BURK|nr:hypothetical protein [Sphaerotilus montanus]
MKRTDEVFGMSNDILPDSYVDRGALDEELAKLLLISNDSQQGAN